MAFMGVECGFVVGVPTHGGRHRFRVSPYACSSSSSKAPPAAGKSVTKWSADGGIVNNTMSLHTFPGGLRGMQAVRDLTAGERVIQVPSDMVLETESVPKRNPISEFVSSKFWVAEKWWTRLATLLLIEKTLNRKENLMGYINALPREFDTPCHWTDEEIEQTQYPPLKEQVRKQLKDYMAIHRRLVSSYRGEEDAPSFDEFLWAVECVRSRAFSGQAETTSFKERIKTIAFAGLLALVATVMNLAEWEQVINGLTLAISSLIVYDFVYPRVLKAVQGQESMRYVLCPVVDFINHRSDIKSDLSYEIFYDTFALTTESFAKGEQVFINYGVRSNDQLLQYYGFVEEDNPNDVYIFSEELVTRALLDLDVKDADITSLLVGTRITLQRKSLNFTEAVEKRLSSLVDSPDRVRDLLRDLCRAELERMPTSFEDDLQLKKASNLAVAFRIEKKKLLRDALSQQ